MAERPQFTVSRFKVGLETPLEGRFVGENKKLVFAPPKWYEGLLSASVVGGSVLALSSFLGSGLDAVLDPTWRLWTGFAVALAGVWAALSHERLTVDLKAGTYTRREGKGPFSSIVRGNVSEFDALVLLAEFKFAQTGAVVVYRLVLHWKASKHPLLVVSSDVAPSVGHGPINSGAGRLLSIGAVFARSLGVPFYDNSHFNSPQPVKPV